MHKTILIVDDEVLLAQLLKLTLELSKQYKCLTAASGEECLDVMKANRLDFVLIDMMMPGMGGLEALKRIKAAESALPVLMMSAIEDKEKIREVLAAGASGYMIKPVDFEVLKTKLGSILPL